MNTANMRPASLPALFNPDLQDDKSLVANFIARQDLLDFLVGELKTVLPQGTVQHRLLIGARGMGKTTLLRRIAAAIRQDPELAVKLIPLTFPEEQYNIKDLADFWLNTLDAVGDELERDGRQNEADALDEAIARMLGDGLARDTLARRAEALLVERCAKLGRRPVLLVDNIDFVFNRIDGRKVKDADSSAYWELREALSRSDAPVLIGGSTRLSEPLIGNEKAFYNFFMIHRLGKLTFEEMCAILAHLAERHGAPRVHRVLVGEKARLRTLYDLTGGNVRTTLMLFHLLSQGVDGNVREDMESLLDNVTPLYKARFEELADQAQVVCHALAMRWNPSAAASVAEDCALDTRIVSAQLDNLFRDGLVEKVKLGRSRKTGYQIAERFFNLWLLMRTSRRMRHKLAYLTRFLESFYDADKRRALGERQLNTSPSSERTLRHAELSWALANTEDDGELRRALEGQAGTLLLDHGQQVHKQIGELIGPGDFPAHQLTLLQCRQLIRNSAASLRAAGLDPDQFELSSMGSISITLEDKQRVANWVATKPGTEKLIELHGIFNDEGVKWAEVFKLSENGLKNFNHAIADGLIELNNTTLNDVKAATKRFNDKDLTRIFCRFLFGGAVKCQSDADAASWVEWGKQNHPEITFSEWMEFTAALHRQGHVRATQMALDVAYQLAGKDSLACNNLGNLLQDHLNRYDEAGTAYRKALEIEPDDWAARAGMAILCLQTGKPDEALRAIDQKNDACVSNPVVCNIIRTLVALQRENWFDARTEFEGLLGQFGERIPSKHWDDLLRILAWAIRYGAGEKMLALLKEKGMHEQFWPLYAGFEAALADNVDWLLDVAPEARMAARRIFDALQHQLGRPASPPA